MEDGPDIVRTLQIITSGKNKKKQIKKGENNHSLRRKLVYYPVHKTGSVWCEKRD